MSSYDEVLAEAREKGEILANKYIFELYSILRDEEHLPPEDCRARIEHDCIDLWSKATIRKFLPEEAKNPKKLRAGKIGAEEKKRLEQEVKLQVVAQTTDGKTSHSSSRAGTDLAENDSVSQEEEESRTFHNEFNQLLAERSPSPELLEANKIISEKDQRIKELEDLARQGNSDDKINSEFHLPGKFAQEIHDTVSINRSKGITQTDLILRHDGYYITAVESLSDLDSNSVNHEMEKSS